MLMVVGRLEDSSCFSQRWSLTNCFPLPQLADILVVLAIFVDARVRVGGGGERVYYRVGAIGVSRSSAGEREDTADSEA